MPKHFSAIYLEFGDEIKFDWLRVAFTFHVMANWPTINDIKFTLVAIFVCHKNILLHIPVSLLLQDLSYSVFEFVAFYVGIDFI